MTRYEIKRHATYQEIVVRTDLNLGLFREILGDLAKADGFMSLNALWAFGPDVRPPAFHEFDGMVRSLQKAYARRPRTKRVALAVPGPFGRSVAEMFQAQTADLPVDLRVFDSPAAARAWVEG